MRNTTYTQRHPIRLGPFDNSPLLSANVVILLVDVVWNLGIFGVTLLLRSGTYECAHLTIPLRGPISSRRKRHFSRSPSSSARLVMLGSEPALASASGT